MTDFDTQLATDYDPAGDGINVTEPEIAAQPEGQDPAESQTDETGGESQNDIIEDLNAPQFAYTNTNGEEIQLTGQQIIDLLEAKQKAAQQPTQQTQTAPVQQPEIKPDQLVQQPQQQPQDADLGFEINQIDFKKVGPDLAAFLDGENGGVEALGPAIAEFQFQTFMQDPRFGRVFQLLIDKALTAREQQNNESASFKQFIGDAPAGDLASFQASNPWAKSPEIAQMGLKMQALMGELEQLRAGNAQAVADAEARGKDVGAKETINNMRAKGTLRAINSRSNAIRHPAGDGIKQKYDLTDPNQRSMAMAEGILKMRQQQ